MKDKKAVITILGMIGGQDNLKKATYYFENKEENKAEYLNTFPLLIKEYSSEYTIVPIFTKEAKKVNEKVLKKSGINFNNFDKSFLINDEKDFDTIFSIINNAIDKYEELIIDVSHGFRHLPILMTVDMIIQNFQDSSKIDKILFAKEVKKFEIYEMIDLKEYLELSNIAFILTTFEKNYTVANHIKSKKYKKLLKELNDFSNDLMALNIGNLNKTSKDLITELKKIDDISIKKQASKLMKTVENLTNFHGKKRYQTYYQLSKNLFEKNYILLSLALLYESIRIYFKSFLKKKHPKIIMQIEKDFKNDLYKIGDFCKNLKWKHYNKIRNITITEKEYNLLKKSFPKELKKIYEDIDKKRNSLAHANSSGEFENIKNDISQLMFKYESLVINKKL